MYNAHRYIDNLTHIHYNRRKTGTGGSQTMATEAQRKAVRTYEKNNYRLNIVFPKDTKERIENLHLDKSNSAFIRDTVLAELERLEKILK